LYCGAPWASLAVVRALDSIGKQIVLRMVYTRDDDDDNDDDGGVDRMTMEQWFVSSAESNGSSTTTTTTTRMVGLEAMERALGRLAALRAVRARRASARDETTADMDVDGEEDVAKPTTTTRYVIHAGFAANVRKALERGFVGLEKEDDERMERGEELASAEAEAKVPDRMTLNAYAKSKWEDLLLTLTGASDAFTRPGAKVSGRLDAQALFRSAGLTTATTSALKKGGQKRLKNAGVTAAGFRFLLTTAQEQIWVLLTHYITDSQKESATSAISFLLRLTFQQPGRAYAMTGVLSDTEQDVVRDLTHLGLLYTFDVKKKWYYVPTLLSSGLSSGFSEGETKASAEGHIIVETNYRVYAYTSSLVEMEILRLFTRADYRLPNLYVGMLTRESVQNALRAGVDAEQIVGYIRAHAHKQVRKKKPSVPHTVCDQIRLWARDMQRVDTHPCVLYCDFPSVGGFYEAVAAEASKRGVLSWRDDASRKLTVRADAHESMKSVVAALKKKLDAAAGPTGTTGGSSR
jgi:transcription initiation factor TFIIH subunit 4